MKGRTVHPFWIAFAALLVLHVGAALRHHFVKHNNVLTRMLAAEKTVR
jgi:cytochrome b561